MIELFALPQVKIDLSGESHLLNGSVVHDFEQDFAQYVGAKYAVGVCSCTMAIFLTLKYLEGQRVKVTVPSMIPAVVPNAVIHSGHKFSLVDNTEWVGSRYTLATLDNGMRVVDSAQEVQKGGYCRENTFAQLYSFYPTKPCGGIDGGMVVTNDEMFALWMHEAVSNGMTTCQDSWGRMAKFPGWKAYMSTVQALVAREAFKAWPERRQRLSEIETMYNKHLTRVNGGRHLYQISVRKADDFMMKMREDGVRCGIHYYATHRMRLYRQYGTGRYPCTEDRGNSVASIPFHYNLTDDQVSEVIEKVKRYK